jgi:hypothetical protein
MPVTVLEKFESRQSSLGDSAQVELGFIVSGTDDDIEAKTSLKAATPIWYDGLIRQSLQIEPMGPGMWDGKVHYGRQEKQPETGESTFSFDTGSGTQHITQSIQTIQRYAPPGKTAPDCGGAIGATNDSVEGVDITLPVYQFSETHYLPMSMVTNAYKGTLFILTGKVNSAAFKGCQAGECLFMGASGSLRTAGDDGDWEITFKFAASPNATGLTIGTITGINKKGWEYLWVRYEDSEDTAANVLVKKPTAVYIEKVYDLADFAALGIGT